MYNFVLICVLFYAVYFMSLFCVLCICVFCVFFDPAFGCYTASLVGGSKEWDEITVRSAVVYDTNVREQEQNFGESHIL